MRVSNRLKPQYKAHQQFARTDAESSAKIIMGLTTERRCSAHRPRLQKGLQWQSTTMPMKICARIAPCSAIEKCQGTGTESCRTAAGIQSEPENAARKRAVSRSTRVPGGCRTYREHRTAQALHGPHRAPLLLLAAKAGAQHSQRAEASQRQCVRWNPSKCFSHLARRDLGAAGYAHTTGTVL